MILHRPSLNTTTRCHSVFSLRSPVVLSRQLSEVATLRFAIGRPSWVRRISGSAPRLPIKITLLTLPAMLLSTTPFAHQSHLGGASTSAFVLIHTRLIRRVLVTF